VAGKTQKGDKENLIFFAIIFARFIKLLIVTNSNLQLWKSSRSQMERKSDVVKVDSELLKKIEELIRKNRFLYVNKKQVVNLALVEFLKAKSFSKSDKGARKK